MRKCGPLDLGRVLQTKSRLTSQITLDIPPPSLLPLDGRGHLRAELVTQHQAAQERTLLVHQPGVACWQHCSYQ